MSLQINPIDISQEEVNSYVDNFGNAAETALAKEVVSVFEQDFAKQIENDPNYFNYDALRSGTAGIFDDLGQTDVKKLERALSDEDILTQFTTAETPNFLRTLFSEAVKAAGSTTVGIKAAGQVGSRIIPPAVATGNPLLIGGSLATTLASYAVPSVLTYTGLDFLEKEAYGEVPAVPPSYGPSVAAVETFGSMAGGIFTPWLLPSKLDLGSIAFINNLAEGQKTPAMVNLIKSIEKIIPEMGNAARRMPKTTLTAEGLATGTTSIAAAGAESIDPGGTATRLGFEVLAGNILPITLLRGVPDIAKDAAEAGSARFGFDAKQKKVFERINEIYGKYATDQDYENLIKNLTDPGMRQELQDAFPGVDFTAGQISDSPIFQTIEAARANRNEDLDSLRERNYRAAKDFTLDLIQALQSKGDQTSVNYAAKLRSSYFDDLLSSRLQKNLDRLANANSRLKFAKSDLGGEQALDSISELGQSMSRLIKDSLQLARKEETSLWNMVPDVPLFTPGREVLDIDTGTYMVPDEEIPGYIAKWTEGLGFANQAEDRKFKNTFDLIDNIIREHRLNLGLIKNKTAPFNRDDSDLKAVTLKELVSLRSAVLQAMRKESAGDAPDNAYVQKLSSFSQDLLDEIEEQGKLIDQEEAIDAFATARDFSKSLNDVFYRSVLGKSFRKRATGEEFAAPETLMKQLGIGGRADLSVARMRQLKNFGEFMAKLDPIDGDPSTTGFDPSQVSTSVDGLLEQYLRTVKKLVGKTTFDPKTGKEITRVDPAALTTFRQENKEILEEFFPQLNIDLANAARAERLFQIFNQRSKATQKKRDSLNKITELANLEISPQAYISQAFNADNAAVQLKELFNLGVRSGRPQRTAQRIAEKIGEGDTSVEQVGFGLRKAILEFALQKAGGEGVFSPSTFRQILFDKMPNSNVSLMDVATQGQFAGRIFKPEEASRLKFMAETLAKVEKADKAGTLVDDTVLEQFGAFRDLYTRFLGAIGGSQAYQVLPGTGSAASLQFGSAGVKYAQEIFNEMPQAKKMDMLDELFTDPDIVATLLLRPKTNEQAAEQTNRVIQFLEKKGFSIPFQLQPEFIREAGEPGADPATEERLENLPEERKRILSERFQASAGLPTPRTAPAPMPAPTLAVAPQITPPSQPVNRARFAAMFPNDPMSALIRQQSAQQGIGSLMG